MLSVALYEQLPEASAIQPVLRAAPEVVGVGGKRAVIRGYVDVPVEVPGVAVHHPLLVKEGLAFALVGTDILRSHRAVLTLDESAFVRLRVRVCDVCGEQRTAKPAEPSSSTLTAPCPQYCAARFHFFTKRRLCPLLLRISLQRCHTSR